MKTIIKGLCYYLLLNTCVVICDPIKDNFNQHLDHPAVRKFREYLQIDTSQGRNLNLAVDFIRRQACELGLPSTEYVTKGGKPICIITLRGQDPTLPSIMLNSHMDVVPVVADEWTYPPFEAHVDDKGNIYARGAQDTKDIAIQYLEAIRSLLQANVTLLRTLHVTFMPDEETGGYHGMKQFIDADEFQKLNVGFVLDEGFTSESKNVLYLMYQDKRPWQMEFTIFGQGGHGHALLDNTAMENAYKMMNLIIKYRREQLKIMQSKNTFDFGAHTSVNVNILKSGVAINVIPTKVLVGVDMRLSVDSNISDVENMVKSWMNAAGNNTELSYIRREDRSDKTVLDESNPFWVAMERALTNSGNEIVPIVCPATSDMPLLRNRGIPAIGFSTKTNLKSRIHGVNEYMTIEMFLRGIDIYFEVIKAIANVQDFKY